MTTHTPPDEIEERAGKFYVRHLDLPVRDIDKPVIELMAAFALSEQSRRDDRLREAVQFGLGLVNLAAEFDIDIGKGWAEFKEKAETALSGKPPMTSEGGKE